jgi:ribosome-associated protein
MSVVIKSGSLEAYLKEQAKFKRKLKSILKVVLLALYEGAGEDIVVLDLENLSDIANFLVLVSGRSEIHCQGLARKLLEVCEREKIFIKSKEGFSSSRWILVDLVDIVVHIWDRQTREYYNLEGLWLDAPRVDVWKILRRKKAVNF